MSAIKTVNLTKTFGSRKREFTAVDNINLDIPPGQIYALIGPNGAGKTTLVKMLVGLLFPSEGSARILNFDITKFPISAKSNFGYVPDEPSGYDYLTGREFLIFTAKLRSIPQDAISNRIEELLEIFPLSDVIDRPMGQYSRGFKQKIAFLAALLSKPKVLIIDEPIVGLDPQGIKKFGSTLIDYAKAGNSVFFVTHILEFAKNYAHKAGVMKAGKIIREMELSKLSKLDNLL